MHRLALDTFSAGDAPPLRAGLQREMADLAELCRKVGTGCIQEPAGDR